MQEEQLSQKLQSFLVCFCVWGILHLPARPAAAQIALPQSFEVTSKEHSNLFMESFSRASAANVIEIVLRHLTHSRYAESASTPSQVDVPRCRLTTPCLARHTTATVNSCGGTLACAALSEACTPGTSTVTLYADLTKKIDEFENEKHCRAS